jgi:hypothetical protein
MIVESLDELAAAAVVDRICAGRHEAVAVCLLNAYAKPGARAASRGDDPSTPTRTPR